MSSTNETTVDNTILTPILCCIALFFVIVASVVGYAIYNDTQHNPTLGDVMAGNGRFEHDAKELRSQIESLKKKRPTLENMERYRQLCERLALIEEHINEVDRNYAAGKRVIAESERARVANEFVEWHKAR